MTDIVESLLPCPFCGAAARTDLLPHSGGPGWVQCSECECDQYMCDTIEEAVAKWNRRAPAQSVPEGWKLVPIEPTAEMIETGCDNNPTMFNEGTDDGFTADVANDVYVAMVRAAPALSSAQCGDPTPSAPDASAHVQRPHE